MRLFLAGLEGTLNYEICREYIYNNLNEIYCLSSFYHMNKRQEEMINAMNKENFLLDSGAFTFRMRGLKGLNIDEYTENYIQFINKHDIKYFFEMDIDKDEKSYKKVLELRKRIEENTGKKCIPVWHDTRGIQAWLDIIEEYDYVAIGGITSTDGKKQEIVKELIKLANKKKVKVHLLGYNRKDLLEYNAYSCDATSWNGAKYGGMWNWDNMIGRPVKQNRVLDKRVKTELQKELFLHNLKVWLHYQRYLKYKGYWRE